MLDPKKLRSEFDAMAKLIHLRGNTIDFNLYHQLEEKRKALQVETQTLQAQRNKRSKEVGVRKAKGEDVQDIFHELEDLRDSLNQKEQALNEILKKQEDFLLHLPNVPHISVPVGKDENDNEEVRVWGEKKSFDFEPRDHVSLGAMHKGLNFEESAKISGSRFVVMHHHFARLHRALAQWMLDLHTQRHGYEEVITPLLVEEHALYDAGQLPKFYDDLFHVKDERKLSLIPTAEVTLVNLLSDQILESDQLPRKFVSHTPCFRSEAGSYGKDTRGMFRVHQFEKVELVQIVHPDKSYEALEELTHHAEAVLQKLNLPYRVVNLCTGDMGFCAAKTYDLEVWLPGQQRYREISSCSNTEDFQARRLKTRFRDNPQAKPELVHTLNGSGLAVGRTFIAVIENYQKASGDIEIPEVLVPYMHGMTVIKAP